LSPSLIVQRMLREYGAITRGRLGEYLRRHDDTHGLYALAADYPDRGGRSLRASLCIASARAFGVGTEDAINSAVAVELMHNAFLVHDDVEDDSEERRGRPTLHLLHGVPIAVNVGDALAVLSLRPLIDNVRVLGPSLALRVLEEAERMARESVEGQAIELAWRRQNTVDLTDSDYLNLILKKTCWYSTIFPTRVGALIGTRDGVNLDHYLRFGFFVGAAFQIQDDLLNLVGNPARYGKELNGDILEGKRTLMLIHLLNGCTPAEKERLRAMLSLPRSQRTDEDAWWVRDRMDEYQSLQYAREIAHGLAGAALHEFSNTFGELPDTDDRRFLEAVATWAIERA
jgi:geranylgeranyl diphosphate synthase type II